jgi:hypothetical protein
MLHRYAFCKWIYYCIPIPNFINTILWTDEKMFVLTEHRRKHIYILPNTDKNSIYTFKNANIRMQCWAGITFDGRSTRLIVLQGKQNSNTYIERIKSIMNESPCKDCTYFMQDNCGYHCSRKAIAWIAEQTFTLLKWPARSPDLNPIEYIWLFMEQILTNYKHTCTTRLAFESMIQSAWEEVTKPKYMVAIRSKWLNNLKMCINLKGGNLYTE